jgi:pyridoxal phosphate enzyme (YggS family)
MTAERPDVPAQDLLQGWDHVARNLARIRESIADSARQAGRDASDIELVAVSKTVPLEGIQAAIDAGQTLFGENRVQEALPKLEALGAPAAGQAAAFHLIGHLQSNKARHGSAFAMVESVDSVKLARALSRRSHDSLAILLEINVSGEASKDGFKPDELEPALREIRALPNLDVQGLMTVAPLAADPEEVRPHFRRLRELRDAFGLDALSMGMTNDYEIAIAEGATLVRIGRAIFGER